MADYGGAAVSPAFLKKLMQYYSQKQTTTGRTLNPEELQGLISGELEARQREIGGQKEFGLREKALNMQELEAKKTSQAATMSGVGQLATGGAGAYMLGKEAGLWGTGATTAATTALPAFTPATLAPVGSLVAPSAVTAPALTGVSTLSAPAMAGSTGAVAGAPAAGTAATTMGWLAPVAAGVAAGFGGKAITGAGTEGHMGGEKYTSAGIGAVGGAATGAAIGSVVPGVGTVIGGIIGGISGAVSGGTVICTELNRQGYLPSDVLAYESQYVDKYIDAEVYQGYRIIADPIVRAMRKSNLVTQFIRPLGCAFAYEMAHRMNNSTKGSILGKIILSMGIPLCRIVARVKNQTLEMEVS